MMRAGNLALMLALLVALAIVLGVRSRQRMRRLWKTMYLFMSEGLDAIEYDKTNEEESSLAVEVRSGRQKSRKAVLSKAKIIIAAWQIAASTETVRFIREVV